MMGIEVIVAGLCLFGGTFFCVTAVIGVLRFPDLYTRLHAATKGVTAGSLLLLSGVAVLEGLGPVVAKIFLIGLFFIATNPIATHAIARAACRERVCIPQAVVDDYREFLDKIKSEQAGSDYPSDRW